MALAFRLETLEKRPGRLVAQTAERSLYPNVAHPAMRPRLTSGISRLEF
jgi:hypothetical protein